MSKKTDPTVSENGASGDDQILDPTSGAETKPSPREAKMAAAVAARKQELGNPTEVVTHPNVPVNDNDLDPTAQKDPDTEQKDPVVPDKALDGVDSLENQADDTTKTDPPPTAASDLPIFEKDGVQMMRLKVNGEVMEMPVDKVQAIAQKNLLADQRLREVAETRRALETREQDLTAREQKLQTSLTHPPRKGAEVNEDEAKTLAKEFVTTLFGGTEDDAVEKFTQLLLRQGASTSIDPEALLAQATEAAKSTATTVLTEKERIAAEQAFNADAKAGFQTLVQKYPQLATDDTLFDLVDSRVERLRTENPDLRPSELMMTAADEIMGYLAPAKTDPPPKTAPGSDTVQDRQARKANLKPVPQGRPGATAQAPAKTPVDTSPAAVAERMRRERAALTGRAAR